MVWLRRRFSCPECRECHLEGHPEFVRNRITFLTRRLARTLMRDVNRIPVRELARRWGLSWHFIMALVASWSELVVAHRRSRPCWVLLADETSLRRRHSYQGEAWGMVRHRDAEALGGFLEARVAARGLFFHRVPEQLISLID